MLLKPITPDLYSDIVNLQNKVHPAYLCESTVVLTSKVYVSPSTCFSMHEEGVLIGYILSIPLIFGEIPGLTESVDQSNENNNLHLHDCVVSPYHRKSGVASALINAVESEAIRQNFKQISLVAVEGMEIFWTHRGWHATSFPVPQEYGNSVLMVKKITPIT